MNKSKIIKTILGLSLLYTIVGFFIIPNIAKKNIKEYLSQNISQNNNIGKVKFNPISFVMEIEDVELVKNKSLISIDYFSVNIDPSSILNGIYKIKLVQYRGIKIKGNISKDGELSLSDFKPKDKAKVNKDNKDENNNEKKFLITKIDFDDIDIDITDYQKPQPYNFRISKLNISINNISNNKKTIGHYNINGTIQNSTKLKIQGAIYELSKVYGGVSIKNMEISQYFDYIQEKYNFDIEAGILDMEIGYEYDKNPKITNSNLCIKDIKLIKNSQKTSSPIVTFDNFMLENISYNKQNNKSIRIDNVSFDGLNINLIKANNTINLIEAFVVEDKNKSKNNPKTNSKNNKKQKIFLKTISIANSNININDKDKKFKNSIKDFTLDLKNIDLEPNTVIKYDIRSRVFDAIFSSSGNMILTPKLKFNSWYNLNDLNLNIFNSYLSKYVDFKLNSAKFYSNGQIIIKDTNKTNTKSIQTNISLLLRDFDLSRNNQNTSLIKWGSFEFEHCKFSTMDKSIKLDKITLDEPSIIFKIFKDKSTNLDNLVKSKGENNNSKDKNTTEESMNFYIDKISLNNGKMDFSDSSLPLPFATKIHTLKGKIKRVSSQSSEPTTLHFTGNIDKYGYAKITGTLDAGNPNNSTDIDVKFENLTLNSFSPYSGKFVGQAIDEGKATLKLKYTIENYQIKGNNKIVISKIKLGKDIDSKEASSIPLGFAIALLEDKDGIIDLNLKVSGDTKNPKFNINEIVWNTFKKLIIKIITSPFSALGDMLGFDAKEIKYIDFEANSSIIIPTQKEKLDKLIEILNDRPKIILKISKTYHTIADKIIKQNYIAREMIETSMKVDDLNYNEAVEELYNKFYTNDGYDKLEDTLKLQYQSQIDNDKLSKKEFNIILTKKAFKGLTKKIIVNIDDFEQLATRRQNQIVKYLLDNNIDTNRIIKQEKYIIQNKTNEMEKIKLELKLDGLSED